MPQGISGILDLYRVKGAAQYGGEAVNQLEHALQCAHQAEQATAAPALGRRRQGAGSPCAGH
jgi:predicted HD phosphohydrolase